MLEVLRKGTATVAVFGDVILDRHLNVRILKISPEAPVPVYEVKAKSAMLGGAANVAANLAGLGCRAMLFGARGADGAGEELRLLLAQGGIEDHMATRPDAPTIVKTRFYSQGQQLLRFDEERILPLPEDIAQALVASLAAVLPQVQAVVLSDYGKGALSEATCAACIALCARASVPAFVDPKGQDWGKYRGAAWITPNTRELALAAGQPSDSFEDPSEADIAVLGDTILSAIDAGNLLVTRGAKGMMRLSRLAPPFVLRAQAREVFDVCGAGDTVIAALAAGLASGLAVEDALRLSNAAAGVVVGKIGTQPAFLEEVEAALNAESGPDRKVRSLSSARLQVQAWRGAGKSVVFTNGCFDLLRAGHIKFLQAAARLGQALVVGLNSDASVRALKGPGRPLLDQDERSTLLAALGCVDMIVVFEEAEPQALIEALRPDVLVKGANYALEDVVGREQVAGWGGRIELLPVSEEGV